MNLTRSVTTGNVTRKQSFPAVMESVSLNCGSVTTTMTVGMTVTSRLTAAGTETVQKAGEDVQVIQTTDVSLNGSSEMEQTNFPRTVPNAKRRATSNVEIKGAFPKDGCVILKMIVGITRMKMMKCAPEDTENAQNQNSDVGMINVYQRGGDATMMMIVAMVVTKPTV